MKTELQHVDLLLMDHYNGEDDATRAWNLVLEAWVLESGHLQTLIHRVLRSRHKY
jgi:hypothetical protein